MISKKLATLCIVGSAMFATTANSAEDVKAIETKRILWVGSSSTTWHGMPKQFSEMINRSEVGFKIDYEKKRDRIVRGGTSILHMFDVVDGKIIEHKPDENCPCKKVIHTLHGANGKTYHERFTDDGYDFVSLQLLPNWLDRNGEKEKYISFYEQIVPLIIKGGAKPFIYATSKLRANPRKKHLFTHESLKEIALLSSQKTGTPLAPCGRVWERVRKERPDIELQNYPLGKPAWDGHPGAYGMALNMFCIYSAMTGRNPEPLILESFVRKVYITESKFRNLKPNPAKWEQETVTFDPELITYFKKVVWEEYLRMSGSSQDVQN